MKAYFGQLVQTITIGATITFIYYLTNRWKKRIDITKSDNRNEKLMEE